MRWSWVGIENVEWFNSGLFEDSAAPPIYRSQIEITLEASGLDRSSSDPSMLGTQFERGLDRDKLSQLGAHYTDSDKIMRIIGPVSIRPLLAEREAAKVTLQSIDPTARADADLHLFAVNGPGQHFAVRDDHFGSRTT